MVSHVATVTLNGLGARGIDRIERVNSSGTTVGYPLYDGDAWEGGCFFLNTPWWRDAIG
ncbi:MAG: hypothetical protein J0H02_10950 [Armatimonadetes bacterium]|nr:hypothetical protein [Armatimonadota bacterium]